MLDFNWINSDSALGSTLRCSMYLLELGIGFGNHHLPASECSGLVPESTHWGLGSFLGAGSLRHRPHCFVGVACFEVEPLVHQLLQHLEVGWWMVIMEQMSCLYFHCLVLNCLDSFMRIIDYLEVAKFSFKLTCYFNFIALIYWPYCLYFTVVRYYLPLLLMVLIHVSFPSYLVAYLMAYLLV